LSNPAPGRLASVHTERNRLTRGDWQPFAEHRQRVTELLIAATGSAQPTLCVLGAGNGNDLDLFELAKHFAQITLVDLDREAMEHCLARQVPDVQSRIELAGGMDVSGILAQLESWLDQPPSAEQIEMAIAAAAQPPSLPNLVAYDVVASSCLLTQLIDSVAGAIGPAHPRFPALVLAVRDAHLRLLSRLTVEGGMALLITDVVSSDTLPQLKTVPPGWLERLLAGAIEQRNFFVGVNPRALARQWQSIAPADQIELHRPWRWWLGTRAYAVCGLGLRKPAKTAAPSPIGI
jgi:hypothetical protein